MAPLNPYYRSVNGVLFDKDMSTLIQYPPGRTGNYSIPDGVIRIEDVAFSTCWGLASVLIPASVTSIGDGAFSGCAGLTRVVVPNGITDIGEEAFSECTGLTSVVIPQTATSIGSYAFFDCTNLTTVVCQGDAPASGHDVFTADDSAIAYYFPGTTGWEQVFSGIPTAAWNLQMQAAVSRSGGGSDGLSINITGPKDLPVIIEACESLSNATWAPVSTNVLRNGSSEFSDEAWTNCSVRFFRLRLP